VATKEIQRLNTLLNELRSFARPRALNLKPIDLVETTEEVLVPEIANYRAAGITVKRQFEESLPPLMLDEDRIKQVILNLCKNAADAMPEGGTLTIKAYQQENGVALEVCDTGTGIPDGLDVFQLFATTKDNGTGVGLPIVKQIIGAHRGKIEYVSKPGEGTTFRVTLPLAKEIGSTTKNSMSYGYKFPADTP
jgi:signal transduction histidine kinase